VPKNKLTKLLAIVTSLSSSAMFVRAELLTRALVIAVVVIASSASSSAYSHPKVIKANIRFRAASTLFRTTWAVNSDTYLAELTSRKHGKTILVHLIDEYPNRFAPLSREIQLSTIGSVLRVYRDPACDLLYSQIVLRAAPGDLMAVLPERLGYKPILTRES
jgi:hypothetical protein